MGKLFTATVDCNKPFGFERLLKELLKEVENEIENTTEEVERLELRLASNKGALEALLSNKKELVDELTKRT